MEQNPEKDISHSRSQLETHQEILALSLYSITEPTVKPACSLSSITNISPEAP